jgi:adenylyltransferase/sulfurtransferase
MPLSREEIARYNRHLIMPEVGLEGQEKLKNAKVLLIGCGGLGSPVSIYLAAAGVGKIGLVDFDSVDFTNLQRQIAFGAKDVGRSKVEVSGERIKNINPDVLVEAHQTRLSSENALDIFKDYDIVIDGTDNFPARYLINDACVILKKPDVYGSVLRFEGQASVFWGAKGPCYRCLFPEPPPPGSVPGCAEGGVLGVLPGIIGLIQATETVKLIIGKGKPLIGRLLLYDALDMKFREAGLEKDPQCPVCSGHPTVAKLIDYGQLCGERDDIRDITAEELQAMIARGGRFTILDVREPREYEIDRIPGSKLIPLGEIARRAGELDGSEEIIVHCRTGSRSVSAIRQLQKMGFKKLRNLKGGILAWSEKVGDAFDNA